MIKVLSEEESLYCHHSDIWIKPSDSGGVDVIAAREPEGDESQSFVRLKVRCSASEFESTLLQCANSGLTVEAYANSPEVALMDRRRIKTIADKHLAGVSL